MFAEIITIGDEILIGQVVDTNSAWIAHELNLIGIKVKQITSVQDDREHILNSLKEAESRAELILITGGLGPTKDDITKRVLCEYFDSKLVFNKAAYANVERLFSSRNYPVTEINRKQAELPEKCIPIENTEGTAFGMWFEKNGKVFISMPGVPFEMNSMMRNHALPKIKGHFKTPQIVHRTILTTGIGESALSELIESWEDALPTVIKLAYLPSPGIVRLRLSATGLNNEDLNKELDQQIEKLKTLINKYIFGFNQDTLEEVVGRLLNKEKLKVSVAESCTGGYLSHLITSVSGSSQYFMGGMITYDNSIKIQLGVNRSDIGKHGAVCKEVVEQMAEKVRIQFNTDFAISTSGIAGPAGGSEEKPVGTVWIAIAGSNGVVSKKFNFGENRERNIIKASIAGLNMLREEILRVYEK